MKKAPQNQPLKALTPFSLLLNFFVAAGLGVLILVNPLFVRGSLNLLCILALGTHGVSSLSASLLQQKSPHPHTFLTGLLSLAGAMVVMALPGLLSGSITLMVGLWSLLVSIIQYGYIVQLAFTHEKGKLHFFLLGTLSLIVALATLFNLGNAEPLRKLSGVYLIVYGLWELVDLAGELINRNVENSKLLSRLRVKAPVALTAMLPSIVLRKLSAEYEHLTTDIVIAKPTPPRTQSAETLEVLFHLGENVAFGFGHVDISLRGKTYSYGCYDEKSNRIFGLLSDGVFLICDTATYLPFCQQVENKLMLGFTLGLRSIDADQIETSMRTRLERDCELWSPADRPEYAINGKLFKVKQGKFAIYNALKTNCAAMAEIIAAGSGLNLLPPSGFVTPGAYFGYLQSELRDPQSNVLRQTVYAHRS
ncbi:MAG: DUF308 domain-containing protein [Clostridia bacterium]